jgi:hypothetical protein
MVVPQSIKTMAAFGRTDCVGPEALSHVWLSAGRLRKLVSSEEADVNDGGDSLGINGEPLGTNEQ